MLIGEYGPKILPIDVKVQINSFKLHSFAQCSQCLQLGNRPICLFCGARDFEEVVELSAQFDVHDLSGQKQDEATFSFGLDIFKVIIFANIRI